MAVAAVSAGDDIAAAPTAASRRPERWGAQPVAASNSAPAHGRPGGHVEGPQAKSAVEEDEIRPVERDPDHLVGSHPTRKRRTWPQGIADRRHRARGWPPSRTACAKSRARFWKAAHIGGNSSKAAGRGSSGPITTRVPALVVAVTLSRGARGGSRRPSTRSTPVRRSRRSRSRRHGRPRCRHPGRW